MFIDQIRDDFERVESAIADGPIYPNVTAEEIRNYLTSRYDFSQTMSLDEVIADVEQMLRTWQVQVTHPRYFGLFNPSVTFASVVADTLVAMYNPQLANWRTSPAGNEIERHTLGWLAAKFGLPTSSIATFTSGGMEANLSAVIVALTHAFPDYGENGLRSLAATPAVYVTAEAHNGYNKLVHMTGLGRRALRIVATDSNLKMDLGDLKKRVAEDRENGFAPFMVVATAGTTATGVIDPLPELVHFCREAGLWLHVDAAWGGSAAISPALRPYLAGIEDADSITCDAHKWLSVPMGAGMFFSRHPESVAAAFRAEVSYMPSKKVEVAFDPFSTSAQWSRRFIGLKLFMALAERGESGYAAMIEHQTRMGDVLRQSLQASGWSIANTTPLPLVCFTRDGLDTDAFLAAMRERQIAWMTAAKIHGASVVRACITSFRTTEADINWVVGEMNRFVEEAGQSSAKPSHDACAAHAGMNR
jgi:glutamate/tyrosine decarboxylase-like PLP-dependent enzyme